MTTAFYAPPRAVHGQQVMLPEDETHHAVRALRKGVGDTITVVDGVGGWYRVRLDQVGERRARGTITTTRKDVGEPNYHLTMAVGLIKDRNRFETFAEKAVELGVHTIVPLQTARTEKTSVRRERLQNLFVAAMKQCGRSRLPNLAPVQSLQDWLAGEDETQQAGNREGKSVGDKGKKGENDENKAERARGAACRLIPHERGDERPPVLQALQRRPFDRVRVLIGPEGGFTDDEVRQAQGAGYTPVSLGPRRLRTETAALTAMAAVSLAHEG
jgi:16S rRNA (uracil1498-N3)-methyltransferase